MEVGQGETEEDEAAVDVAVGAARGVFERFAAHQLVERQLGAPVVVEAGGGAQSAGVGDQLADGGFGAGGLAVHGGEGVADGGVEVEQAHADGVADEGPGRDDLGERSDVVDRVVVGRFGSPVRGD